jgi:hypothetical protein
MLLKFNGFYEEIRMCTGTAFRKLDVERMKREIEERFEQALGPKPEACTPLSEEEQARRFKNALWQCEQSCSAPRVQLSGKGLEPRGDAVARLDKPLSFYGLV